MPKKPCFFSWIAQNGGDGVWIYDMEKMFCRLCNFSCPSRKLWYVVRHANSTRHINNLEVFYRHKSRGDELGESNTTNRILLLKRHLNTFKDRTTDQAKRPQDLPLDNSFLKDLFRLFIRLNIPLYKVEHSFFKYFLEKYTGRRIPSRRKLGLCIREESKEILSFMKNSTEQKGIFLMWDVREDTKKNRFKGVLLMGPLDGTSLERPFLIDVKVKKPDALDEFLRKSLLLLYGVDFDLNRIKLFVSKGTSLCLQAADGLKLHSPEMIHVSCVAHALHEALNESLAEFVDVKNLIAKTREILDQSDEIRSNFALVCPEPLPGEFMDAVSWHYCNFEAIRNFITSSADKVIDDETKALYLSDSVYLDLRVIHTNLRGVDSVITKLDKRLSLLDSLNLIERELENIVLEPHKSKFKELLQTLPGFTALKHIGSQLLKEPSGQFIEYSNSPIGLSYFEEAFILFAKVYTYERVAMTENNLRDVMVASWNVNIETTIIPS